MSKRAIIGWSALLFLVQTSVLPYWWTWRPLPDLWLAVIVLATIFYDARTGFWFALCGGVAMDIMAADFFGLHLLGYFIGVVCLLPAGDRLRVRWRISFLLAALTGLVCALAGYAVLWLADYAPAFGIWFLRQALPAALLTAGWALPLHALFRWRKGWRRHA